MFPLCCLSNHICKLYVNQEAERGEAKTGLSFVLSGRVSETRGTGFSVDFGPGSRCNFAKTQRSIRHDGDERATSGRSSNNSH